MTNHEIKIAAVKDKFPDWLEVRRRYLCSSVTAFLRSTLASLQANQSPSGLTTRLKAKNYLRYWSSIPSLPYAPQSSRRIRIFSELNIVARHLGLVSLD